MNLLEMMKNEKVEWRKLGEVCEIRRGSFPQPYGSNEWYGGESAMPFIQVADMLDYGLLVKKNTNKTISLLAQPKSVFVEKGTVIVSIQGTIGRVAITDYDSYVDRTIGIFYKYKININKKYFAYQVKNIFDFNKDKARGSTLKTITKEEFKEFLIPIPSLETQEKIVKTLDKFTKHVTELQAEIELRKKQYEYYREKLLDFKGEVYE